MKERNVKDKLVRFNVSSINKNWERNIERKNNKLKTKLIEKIDLKKLNGINTRLNLRIDKSQYF